MNKYTVVLLRPDYMADPYGQDVYVAYVEADNHTQAVERAQKEAFCADGGSANHAGDYALCVMFAGHHEPVFYGFLM